MQVHELYGEEQSSTRWFPYTVLLLILPNEKHRFVRVPPTEGESRNLKF